MSALLDRVRMAEAHLTTERRCVGMTLRIWREGSGRSLRQMARELNVDPSHLSKVERGRAWNETLIGAAVELLRKL